MKLPTDSASLYVSYTSIRFFQSADLAILYHLSNLSEILGCSFCALRIALRLYIHITMLAFCEQKCQSSKTIALNRCIGSINGQLEQNHTNLAGDTHPIRLSLDANLGTPHFPKLDDLGEEFLTTGHLLEAGESGKCLRDWVQDFQTDDYEQ